MIKSVGHVRVNAIYKISVLARATFIDLNCNTLYTGVCFFYYYDVHILSYFFILNFA